MAQDYNQPKSSSESLTEQLQKDVDAFAALRSHFSGVTEPTAKVAYQFWADTSEGWLKIRNAGNSGWVYLFKLGDVAGAGVVQRAAAWVTSGTTAANGPVIPANHIVLDKGVAVEEAFDSSGSDLIRAGNTDDDDAYGQDADVSTTGDKTLAAGAAFRRHSSVARTPRWTYTAGGGAPTTGKALCWITYAIVPAQP